MARTTYYGICSLCEARVSKAAMGRHLETCAPSHDHPKGKAGSLFRLRVEGADAPVFWLDLEISAQAKLTDLDRFLRDIWLECCGHLSAFRIGRFSYSYPIEGPFGGWSDERSMNVRLREALGGVGTRFVHEYDFGTTTELSLRVTAQREGAIGKPPLRLLARNEAPVWPCSVCKKPATRICSYCVYEANPFFCDNHAEKHDCGEEAFLPVVNSPRMGMCGYEG